MKKLKDPIIVVGMHRSGTSVVARILSHLNVNMGHLRETNHEPRAYIALNNWILLQAGTTWQYPHEFDRLLRHSEARNSVIESISLASERFVMKFMHWQLPSKKYCGWGWKDPRNSITLPIWIALYPSAKIIYVKRHGVPVASSLMVRKKKWSPNDLRWWHRVLAPIKPGPGLGARLWDIDSAFDLWEEYCRVTERNCLDSQARVLNIRYEDLMKEPHIIVDQLKQFVDSNATSANVARAIQEVKRKDPFSFRQTQGLGELEKRNSQRLKKLGY